MIILQLKNSLIGALHGTTLNSIYDINGTIEDCAGHLLADIDPQETKRIVSLAAPIYDQVYDYALPSDVKGNRIIDIRPQANRESQDYFSQTYNRAFDYSKTLLLNPQFSVQHNTGIKTIRISDPLLNTGIKINDANEIIDSGTWSANGNASNLAEDNINYATGGGALRFDLSAAAGTGGIVNSTFTAVDLTDHLNQSTIFVYVYLPTGADFTSVALRWGSDATNYYTKTVTTNYQGNAFITGWNLLGFDWATATTTGTPVVTAIDYLDFIFTYDGTLQTAVRVNSVVSRLGRIWEIEYYSKYLFRDATTNAFSDQIAGDSDLINLDTESYHLLEHLTMYHLCQQVAGYSSTQFDAQFFKTHYDEGIKRYKSIYKSEVSLPQSTYYRPNKSNYSKWAGYRMNR